MGLCPACLLRQGMEERRPSHFSLPALEDLSALFPGLEILELIGRGGMGIVYKARQRDLDRVVALKILPAAPGSDPAFAERFTREARALAKLSHPHIVAIHDFGQREGRYFFLMEYVDGANLRQAMGAGQMSPEAAMAIVPQICDALQYAHDQGIVHRDIKPENVLVEKGGRVKIADFGLAKILANANDITLTQAGAFMGTTHYMAPEQVERPESVDRRADIFSLGVVFYQMLTGELPIGRFAPPSRSVKVDVRIDEVVLRALENKPDMRFAQAGDVKTEVEHIRTTPAPPPPTPPPLPKPAKNQPARFAILLRLAIPLLAIGLTMAMANRFGVLQKAYVATTTLQLKIPEFGSSQPNFGLDPRFVTAMEQSITSKAVLEPLVSALGLPGEKTKAMLDLQNSISIRPIRNTELVQISVTAPKPTLAADWANAITEQFRRVRLEEQRERTARDIALLRAEVDRQRQSVDSLRIAAAKIARDMNYQDPNTASGLSLDETKERVNQLKANSERAATLSDAEFLQENAPADSGEKRILSKIHEARTEEVGYVAAGMGDNHPNIKSVRARIDVMEKQAAENAFQLRNRLLMELRLAQQQLADMTASGQAPPKYLQAKREYLVAKNTLEAAEQKLATVTLTSALPESPAVIWERAEPPALPYKPSLPLLFLVVACGAIAGGILAFLPRPEIIAGSLLAGIVLAGVSVASPSMPTFSSPPPAAQATPPPGIPAVTPTQIPPAIPAPSSQPKVARISIGGDVRSPQLLDYADDLTLMRAIMAAGGLTEYANQKQVRLTRDGKVIILNLQEIRKDPSKDIPLQPGDSIDVPQSFW